MAKQLSLLTASFGEIEAELNKVIAAEPEQPGEAKPKAPELKQEEHPGIDQKTPDTDHTEYLDTTLDENEENLRREDFTPDIKMLEEAIKKLAKYVLETSDPDALMLYKTIKRLLTEMKLKDQNAQVDLEQGRYDHDSQQRYGMKRKAYLYPAGTKVKWKHNGEIWEGTIIDYKENGTIALVDEPRTDAAGLWELDPYQLVEAVKKIASTDMLGKDIDVHDLVEWEGKELEIVDVMDSGNVMLSVDDKLISVHPQETKKVGMVRGSKNGYILVDKIVSAIKKFAYDLGDSADISKKVDEFHESIKTSANDFQIGDEVNVYSPEEGFLDSGKIRDIIDIDGTKYVDFDDDRSYPMKWVRKASLKKKAMYGGWSKEPEVGDRVEVDWESEYDGQTGEVVQVIGTGENKMLNVKMDSDGSILGFTTEETNYIDPDDSAEGSLKKKAEDDYGILSREEGDRLQKLVDILQDPERGILSNEESQEYQTLMNKVYGSKKMASTKKIAFNIGDKVHDNSYNVDGIIASEQKPLSEWMKVEPEAVQHGWIRDMLDAGYQESDMFLMIKAKPYDDEDKEYTMATTPQDLVLKTASMKKIANDKLLKHLDFDDLALGVEWPKDTMRQYSDGYKSHMKCDYGFVRNSMGADGEDLDVYIGDPTLLKVFRVSQLDDEGNFDEYKYMLGFPDIKAATSMFLQHQPLEHFGGTEPMDLDTFRKICRTGQEDISFTQMDGE